MTATDYDGANRIRACTRKRSYGTEVGARTAAASIRRRNEEVEIQVYSCRHCGQFHVGRSPGQTTDTTAEYANGGRGPRRFRSGENSGRAGSRRTVRPAFRKTPRHDPDAEDEE